MAGSSATPSQRPAAIKWTLPNMITLARIGLTPVIALLPFIQGYWPKVIAFIVFLVAAFSDLLDGYLARRYGTISELGMLLDPIADKLLLFATLIPIFWITRHPTIIVDYRIPWWGSLPVWVALLLVGREVLITVFRFFAKRRGIVIPAVGAGKLKAVVQNIFIGATIAWFAWKDAIAEMHLAGAFRNFWDEFHGWFVSVTLAGAIVLTVYSLLVYLYRYRALLKVGK
jgi:CDP-diacylglycerol--glycerol-3-phosphate 3-phosphatidyltransferase